MAFLPLKENKVSVFRNGDHKECICMGNIKKPLSLSINLCSFTDDGPPLQGPPLPGSATPRIRHSQGPPLPGTATPRVRYSQGVPLYAASERFDPRIHFP